MDDRLWIAPRISAVGVGAHSWPAASAETSPAARGPLAEWRLSVDQRVKTASQLRSSSCLFAMAARAAQLSSHLSVPERWMRADRSLSSVAEWPITHGFPRSGSASVQVKLGSNARSDLETAVEALRCTRQRGAHRSNTVGRLTGKPVPVIAPSVATGFLW